MKCSKCGNDTVITEPSKLDQSGETYLPAEATRCTTCEYTVIRPISRRAIPYVWGIK
jgi:hypothetical protein